MGGRLVRHSFQDGGGVVLGPVRAEGKIDIVQDRLDFRCNAENSSGLAADPPQQIRLQVADGGNDDPMFG